MESATTLADVSLVMPSRRLLALVCASIALLGPTGCACDGGPASADGGEDAGPATDAPAAASDAGNPFLVPDAGTVAGPACTSVEHLTSPLPPLEEGQRVVRVHGDRVLVIERPNETPPPYTTLLRFYTGRVGETPVRVAEHTFDRNVGLVRAARFRDGAWDVLVDLFSHEGLVVWMRVSDDGAITLREHLGPGLRLEVRDAFEAGPAFLLLASDASTDASVRPTWLARISETGEDEAILLADADRARREIVVRSSPPRVVILEHDEVLGRPPRIADLSLDPLRAPEASAWRAITGEYPRTGRVEARLFDTASGLVMGEFVVPTGETATLRLAWLDEALSVGARWSIETTVLGQVRVAGAFPSQEIVVTLPDSPGDLQGPATVFHGRASAPATVSALSPIGRAHAVFTPELVVGDDGRVSIVHFDDRIDIERVCEAP